MQPQKRQTRKGLSFFVLERALVTSLCSVKIALIINELQTLSRNRVDNCAILLQ